MTDIMGAGEPQNRPEPEVDEDVLAEGEPHEDKDATARAEKDTDVMGSGEEK